jgi:hypothetical protein
MATVEQPFVGRIVEVQFITFAVKLEEMRRSEEDALCFELEDFRCVANTADNVRDNAVRFSRSRVGRSIESAHHRPFADR